MDFDTDDADARAGLDYLETLPGIETKRPLGIVGHSRGGMTALRVAGQDSRVRTVVALAPPTDMARYMRAMELLSPTRYTALASTMGTPEERPELFRQLSALTYAERIRVPVLLVCGTQDLHAPLDHSQWMKEALTASGNQRVRLDVLDGVGHFFERMYFGYEFDRVCRLTVDWLGTTLTRA
jgi:dipeptidyl aminopeptidase/acylaminoacyl peptidase